MRHTHHSTKPFGKTIPKVKVPETPKLEKDHLRAWPEPYKVNPYPTKEYPHTLTIHYSFRGKPRQVTLRVDELDVKTIEHERRYLYQGAVLREIRFRDSKGKPWTRSGVVRIKGKYYHLHEKWTRIRMEKNKKKGKS